MPSGYRAVKLRIDAHDDVGRVLPEGPLDGHEAAAVVELVLHELAGRELPRGGVAPGREHADELVGVHEPPLRHPQDLLLVLRERGDGRVLRCAPADDDGPSGRLRQVDGDFPGHPTLAGNPTLDRDALQPEALGGRRVAGDERVEVFVRHVEDGPDVQDHTVAVETLAGRPARLHAADRPQRLEEHPLELGQLDHVPRGAAHRREVADLRHDEEPLVARVALGHGPEEVHVVPRRQPLEVEVLQPVQLQPLRHHGVRVAEEGLLGVAPRGQGAEREVLHPGRPRGHDHDPPERPREGRPGQHRPGFRGVRLGLARPGPSPEEDVAHQVPTGRDGGGQPSHAVERRGEAGLGGVGQERVVRAALAIVARHREGMAVDALHVDPVEGADPVEAPEQDLQDGLSRGRPPRCSYRSTSSPARGCGHCTRPPPARPALRGGGPSRGPRRSRSAAAKASPPHALEERAARRGGSAPRARGR